MDSINEETENNSHLMFSNLLPNNIDRISNKTNKVNTNKRECNAECEEEKSNYCLITYFNIKEREFKHLHGHFIHE